MSEAPTDPNPAAAADVADGAAAPAVEKTEKQLKREAEKKAKKQAEADKKAAKLAARQVRGQGGGTITVGVVTHPPVELEPPSGTRVSVYLLPPPTPPARAASYAHLHTRASCAAPRAFLHTHRSTENPS